VLDDYQGLTNSIVAHFEASGYDARPCLQDGRSLGERRGAAVNGYVEDWIVGEKSVLKLIASLPEQDRSDADTSGVSAIRATSGGRQDRGRDGRGHADRVVKRYDLASATSRWRRY
jgi:hypothetical protein